MSHDTIGDLQAVLLRHGGTVSLTWRRRIAVDLGDYGAHWAHVDGRSWRGHGETLEAAIRALVELLEREET